MNTVIIAAGELQHALRAVEPHAGRDATLPALNAIQLEVVDGALMFIACDRYTLGIFRAEPFEDATPDPAFKALIPYDAVKRILATIKHARRDADKSVRMVEADGVVTVSFGGAQVVVETVGSEFPQWRILVPGAAAPASKPVAVVAFNPDYLARFARAARDREVMTLRVGATAAKPVLVTVGDQFVGVIMPTKEVTESDMASWMPSGAIAA